jgi:release factor glutamine methyltransferase
VVSNPPYVRRDDPHLARGDVRFEPRAALVAGADGLAEIRRIAPRSLRYLTPGGALAVEHGADQGEAVRALFGHAHLRAVETASDLAGQARVTFGRRD